MNKFHLVFLGLFLSANIHVQAQSVADSVPLDKLAAGIGAGYDFGGYGANAIFYPYRSVGVFGGIGYTPAGVGYNAGIKLRLVINKSATPIMPFITAMYGYYAYAAPKDYAYFNKIFYGPTVGAGVDYRPNNSKFGYLTATILVPIRNESPKEYLYNLNNFQSISYSHKLHAISASIGYKFILLNGKK